MDKNKLKKEIICMIPAREGSVRLKYKNLSLINDLALIEYSIINAKKSKIFHEIYVNSDSSVFRYFSEKHEVSFYKRKKILGSSSARSDDLIFDFITNNNLNDGILLWLNPIAPLLDEKIIKKVIIEYQSKGLSSAITSNSRRVHSVYKNICINFKKDEKFSKTQDLKPVHTFNYAIMMWDIKKFIKNYSKKNYCIFIDKFRSIDIPEHNSFIVKNKYDLKLVENFLKFNESFNHKVKYHKLVKNFK